MTSERWDVLIQHATIYDGGGSPPVKADVALHGERIAAVGPRLSGTARALLDATGLSLAPGFIDVHSHDDLAVLVSPEMDFKVMQGVTTDVVGNCGLGVAPYEAAAQLFRMFDPHLELPRWDGHKGYLAAIDQNPPSLNVMLLVGHNTLRLAAMGNAQREPGQAELLHMHAWLQEGLDAGAVGLSTGLIYEPGRYARTEEIIALARTVAEAGGLYTTHMRNEAGGLLDAVREALRVGEEGGVPVQISHHKASGKDNWGRVRDSLRLLEEARTRGLDVTADQYPYTSGSTVLSAIVQNNALNEQGVHGGVGRVEPHNVRFASTPRHPEYEGKTLHELSEQFGLPAEAGARRVLEQEGLGAVVIVETMDEGDVRTVLRHPTTMIGSDGIPSSGANPHPRLYGTFPRVLGRYARVEGLLSLEEAVYRMTGFPATKFRLRDRGFVRPGSYADLVLFDPATIIDTATYAAPRQYPAGIHHVFVNGVQVVRDGRHTGARPGRAVRRE
ncbi:MAG: D-aminoacylase [Thermodesulfobacteriota bacterium]|jgi:N-acyl-D-amino-acid deacylase